MKKYKQTSINAVVVEIFLQVAVPLLTYYVVACLGAAKKKIKTPSSKPNDVALTVTA